MKGKLSTHVLDNHAGIPAAGLDWTLSFFDANATAWTELAQGTTNGDGRPDGTLLDGAALVTGRYRLSFELAAYYRDRSVPLSDPPFLDTVCIEVNLLAGQSYHVPLLMTPWSYSTYRGS